MLGSLASSAATGTVASATRRKASIRSMGFSRHGLPDQIIRWLGAEADEPSWEGSTLRAKRQLFAGQSKGARVRLRAAPNLASNGCADFGPFSGHFHRPNRDIFSVHPDLPKRGCRENCNSGRTGLMSQFGQVSCHKQTPYMYAYMRVRRTSGIATSCHPAQLPREDRARPPGRRATVAARGR